MGLIRNSEIKHITSGSYMVHSIGGIEWNL
nr:MAG TPA: hypothetical protein [Caudoviricetes sp.]